MLGITLRRFLFATAGLLLVAAAVMAVAAPASNALYPLIKGGLVVVGLAFICPR